MKRQIKIFFIIGLLFISGCIAISIIDTKHLSEVEKLPFETLQLKPDAEFLDLRITLFRQFTMSSPDPMSNEMPEKTNKPNSYYGFDIGYGLFVDDNGNISLKILDLFGISLNDNFVIENYNQRNKLLESYTKIGDTVKYERKFYKKTYFIAERNGNIIFNNGKKSTVFFQKNDGVYTKRNDNKERVIFYRDEKGFYLKGLIGKKYYLREENGNLDFPWDFEIQNHGDKLFVNMYNFDAKDLTIIRSKDEYFCFDYRFAGTTVKIKDNVIEVYDGKVLQQKIVLKSHSTTSWGFER